MLKRGNHPLSVDDFSTDLECLVFCSVRGWTKAVVQGFSVDYSSIIVKIGRLASLKRNEPNQAFSFNNRFVKLITNAPVLSKLQFPVGTLCDVKAERGNVSIT